MTFQPRRRSSDAHRPDTHPYQAPSLSAVTSLVGNGGRQYPLTDH
jgi:hypothetical protein